MITSPTTTARTGGARRGRRLVTAVVLAVAMTALGACESVFPPPPENSGAGRRIVYSVGQQRVWLVEANEHVTRSYLVSGRAGTPAPGVYRVFSKSRYTTSLNGAARMEWMVRFAWGRTAAIGFHSIPVNSAGVPLQSEAQLGTYQSAGCVRQHWSDAEALWNWAPVGTTVVVVK